MIVPPGLDPDGFLPFAHALLCGLAAAMGAAFPSGPAGSDGGAWLFFNLLVASMMMVFWPETASSSW
jgi:hypothetical protein